MTPAIPPRNTQERRRVWPVFVVAEDCVDDVKRYMHGIRCAFTLTWHYEHICLALVALASSTRGSRITEFDPRR